MALPRRAEVSLRVRDGMLTAGRMLSLGLRAEAGLEIEAAREILGRRRILLVLAVSPAVLFAAAEGVAAAAMPEVVGGKYAYAPALTSAGIFAGSILVGLLAGLCTGVIGAGGGYIITPAMMSIGIRGILCVGTDQFHIFANSIMGTAIHKKLGNVNIGLALWFVLGSCAGVTLGGWLNRLVYALSPSLSDCLIGGMYILFLGLLGFYALYDWIRARRSASEQTEKGGKSGAASGFAQTAFAERIQKIPMKPRIRFDDDIVPGGRSIGVYPVIISGVFVGTVAAVMGVGGGFLIFPIFVYGMGVSSFTTVGTSVLQILFTSAYSSIAQYAIYGFILYSAAMGMLLGSLLGIQIGATVTTLVKGTVIRGFYALTVLAGFVNRLAAMPRTLSEGGFVRMDARIAGAVDTVGVALFFGLIGIFVLWVLWTFLKGLPELRRRSIGASRRSEMPGGGTAGNPDRGTAGGCGRSPEEEQTRRDAVAAAAAGIPVGAVADRRSFLVGAAALASLLIVLVSWMLPVIDGRTGLRMADDFFNGLSKKSSDRFAETKALAASLKGRRFEAMLEAADPGEAEAMARLFASAGAEVSIAGGAPREGAGAAGGLGDADDLGADGKNVAVGMSGTGKGARIRVAGDLGRIGSAVIADAEVLFRDSGASPAADGGAIKSASEATADRTRRKEVVYRWWTSLGHLKKTLAEAGDAEASSFAASLMARACEPAYNFAGIVIAPDSGAIWRLAALLGFYLAYTLWYGSAIMLMMKGLGLSARTSSKKEA